MDQFDPKTKVQGQHCLFYLLGWEPFGLSGCQARPGRPIFCKLPGVPSGLCVMDLRWLLTRWHALAGEGEDPVEEHMIWVEMAIGAG